MKRRRLLAALLVLAAVAVIVGASDARSPVRERLNIPVNVVGEPAAKLDVFSSDSARTKPLPMLLWIHGGGYISGSPEGILALAPAITRAGFIVASVGYSLAPGSRYPTQLRQASAALAYLRTHAAQFGGDPNRILIGGDSAGAQIASELAAVQSSHRFARIVGLQPVDRHLRGVVLYCGLYDVRTVGVDPLANLNRYLTDYTGTTDWQTAGQLSTVRWVTHDFPPTLISDATGDPFYPQSLELEQALRGVGAKVRFSAWPGLHHDFEFDTMLPQARATLRRTIEFARSVSRPASESRAR